MIIKEAWERKEWAYSLFSKLGILDEPLRPALWTLIRRWTIRKESRVTKFKPGNTFARGSLGTVKGCVTYLRRAGIEIRKSSLKGLTLGAATEAVNGVKLLLAHNQSVPKSISFGGHFVSERKVLAVWHPASPNKVTLKQIIGKNLAKKQHNKGWWATGASGGLLLHEWAHARHAKSADGRRYLKEGTKLQAGEKSVAKQVSGYAATNVVEFVAETYAGILTGKQYSAEVFALYKKYKGPKI